MPGIKSLVGYEKMWRVEPIRGSPKTTSLDSHPAGHLDDRKAASPEQFERLPMLGRHLCIDQERHSFELQRPLRAEELQQTLDHPMAERHAVYAHQRESAIDL